MPMGEATETKSLNKLKDESRNIAECVGFGHDTAGSIA
jgi:hypothetical protein